MASHLHLPTYLGLGLKNWIITNFYHWILVKWVGNDWIMKKLIDFCHFEFWESEKIPVKTIRNGHFKFFCNEFRSKNMGRSYHQINFLLQNINNGDKMKAWKHLTPHSMSNTYRSKVLFFAVPEIMKILASRYLKAICSKNKPYLFMKFPNGILNFRSLCEYCCGHLILSFLAFAAMQCSFSLPFIQLTKWKT